VRERVLRARAGQLRRQGGLNAALRPRDLRERATLPPEAQTALQRWASARSLSARGFHRAWRVARTLADLDETETISEHHVLEALGYRIDEPAA
jgi:magnesium chelatase family protein